MISKPKPGERSGPIEKAFKDDCFSTAYPYLNAMLTSNRYDDHSTRVTSTLLIFCDNGVLRLCLNDRDNNRSAFFTDATFDGALSLMEIAISTSQVEWKTKGNYGSGANKTPF